MEDFTNNMSKKFEFSPFYGESVHRTSRNGSWSIWDDPEGIIVLFCLQACIGLPVVERDFHSRQQQAAAEAANPRGQVVQMA